MSDLELRKKLGSRIKKLRKQQKWTQKDLSAKIDVRFSQLNKYEAGLHVPPVEKLILLAEIFNTTVDYLITGNGKDQKPMHNLRLLDRFRALAKEDIEDQEIIIKLIDALVFKRNVEGALNPLAKKNDR